MRVTATVVSTVVTNTNYVYTQVIKNHGAGSVGSQHYLQDYFVHNLLGVEPPDWNRVAEPGEPTPTSN